MKSFKKLLILLAGVLLLTACGADEKAGANYVSEDGSVRFGRQGAAVALERDEEDEVAPVTVDYFFDPACGPCALYADATRKIMTAEMNAGNVEVVYHPVAFLNSQTPDDFSNRAGAYILAVSEYAPEKASAFVSNVVTTDFIPKTNDKTGIEETPDEKFIDIMKEIGMTEEQIQDVEDHKEHFVSLVIAATEDFTTNEKWVELSPAQGVFTPFVLVNKTGELENKALDFTSSDKSVTELLQNSINELK